MKNASNTLDLKALAPRIDCLVFVVSTADILDIESDIQFSSVQPLSCVQLFATPLDCSMPGYPVHHQLLELAQTHAH